MKCCIIGGAGFIGSYTVRQLIESGRDVVVLDRSSKSHFPLPPKTKYISGDYSDRSLLRRIISDADEVIDLAYTTVPKTSFENPTYDILSNLPQSVGLLEEAIVAKIKKLVVVSSGGTVYGVTSDFPLKEEHATNPISPYGITKLTIEKYAGLFAVLADRPVPVVRPGNAYGEGQTVAEQGFIATAIQAILLRKKFDLFGDLGTVRDYIHVADIARGILAALDCGKQGQVYNIGSGIGRNNIEVLEALRPFAQRDGYAIEVNTLPHRKFDVPINVLDSTKLRQVSGWEPKISFEQGIQQTWEAALAKFSNT